MQEIWKNVKGYEGLYEVSNFGRVKSLRKEKILKLGRDKKGYLIVGLCKNGKQRTFKAHRLVTEHFLNNPYNLPYVNHKDGNKTNNNVSNLEWCTQKENIQHAIANDLFPHKKIYQYDLQGNFIREWENILDVEKELKIFHSNISNCCNGIRKTTGGFKWRYAN